MALKTKHDNNNNNNSNKNDSNKHKMDNKGRVATSLKINSKLWKRAKMEALRRDIDVQVFVEEALQGELSK